MSDAITALIGPLSPGQDVFVALQDYLDSRLYPHFPSALWNQTIFALGCFSLIILANTIGLVTRAARGKLHFIVHDGNCTRLDWKTGVPLLWICESALQIIFTFVFRHDFHNKTHTTRLLGSFWFLLHIVLVISYSLFTLHVLASAPQVRRFLGKLNYGAWLLNGGWILFCAAMLAGLLPTALKYGDAFRDLATIYTAATALIKQAAAAQDSTLLLNLEPSVPLLFALDKQRTQNHRLTSAIYAGYMFILLLSGTIPSLWLAKNVKRKIAQLEVDNPTQTILEHTATQYEGYRPSTEIQLSDLGSKRTYNEHNLPPQPKDRPFGTLLEITPQLPPRFEVILQDKSQSRGQRASKLRSALAADFRALLALLFMETSFICILLFWAIEGGAILSPQMDYMMGFAYPAYNFAIPALIMAYIFLQDSLRPDGIAKDDMAMLTELRRENRQFKAPNAVGITCQQVVNIDYSEERKHASSYLDMDHEGKDKETASFHMTAV